MNLTLYKYKSKILIKKLILLNFLLIFNLAIASVKEISKDTDTVIFTAGEHFQILASTVCDLENFSEKPINHKLTAIMFFSYGCAGCREINKSFSQWKNVNKHKIEVYRYPVAFHKPWENLARLYYVHQELFPESNGEDIFNEIYANHKRLWLEQEMIDFYAKHNISKELFLKKYNSFDIDRKVKKAIEATSHYKIFVTPNLIINGKNNSYMINFTMVKDPEMLFKVADYLIKNNPTK
jgi:protein dithiol oxidoreductase (disulfide-forming)